MKEKYKFLIKRILYYFYGEKFFKRFDYNWSNYPSRINIIQKIIDKQKYSNYLEIGCDNDENFSKVIIKNKIENGEAVSTDDFDNVFENNVSPN